MQNLNVRIKKMSMSMFMHYNPRRFCDIFKKGPNPHIVLKSSTYFIGLLVHHKHWFEPVKCHETHFLFVCQQKNGKTGFGPFYLFVEKPGKSWLFLLLRDEELMAKDPIKGKQAGGNPFYQS